MSAWNETDDKLLTQLYVDDKLDFLPICTKLKRKCKDVKQRIIHLKLKPHNYDKSDNNNSDITDITNNTDNTNKPITNKSNTNLKIPTKDLRKQTNIIFDQIDNIYQVFNNISSIYTNITNITNTINTTKEQIQ
jgi:hypothetical protein